MITDYLLREDGDRILLEDGSGAIEIETAGELTRVTQAVVEAFCFIPINVRTTQHLVEVFDTRTARTTVTQAVVEVFVNLPPCTSGELPVDDVAGGGSCPTDLLP